MAWRWSVCGTAENEISIFKKLVSRRKHEVLQNFLVNRCSDVGFQKTQWTNTSRWHCTPNHHRLWKLHTGLHATWAMSFSTLPPDSRTLVSKLNTKLALIWKEDFGPLGNSPVLLLLSPGKTPLTLSVVQEWLNKRNTTTVAKFLDTSVCGGSWCLDPGINKWTFPRHSNLLRCTCIYDNTHLKYSTSIFLKRNEPLVSRKLKTLVEYGRARVWELKRSVFISLGWH